MAINSIGPSQIKTYLELLENNPNEVVELSKELLIHVTSFFRDEDVFYQLAAQTIPDLLRANPGRILRIWVAGCSTGEEAYSIGIICLEGFVSPNFRPC